MWYRLLLQIHILNDKQCRSRSFGFFRSHLIWGYTVCVGRVYPASAGLGLTLGKIFSRRYIEIFFLFFPRKQDLAFQTICRKCHILFSGKSKKKFTSLLAAELAKRMVKVKEIMSQCLNNFVNVTMLSSTAPWHVFCLWPCLVNYDYQNLGNISWTYLEDCLC